MTSIECLYFLSKVGGSVELHHLAVDPGPAETGAGQLAEDLDVLPLAAAHHRSEHLESGALLQRQQLDQRSAAETAG